MVVANPRSTDADGWVEITFLDVGPRMAISVDDAVEAMMVYGLCPSPWMV